MSLLTFGMAKKSQKRGPPPARGQVGNHGKSKKIKKIQQISIGLGRLAGSGQRFWQAKSSQNTFLGDSRLVKSPKNLQKCRPKGLPSRQTMVLEDDEYLIIFIIFRHRRVPRREAFGATFLEIFGDVTSRESPKKCFGRFCLPESLARASQPSKTY